MSKTAKVDEAPPALWRGEAGGLSRSHCTVASSVMIPEFELLG